MQSISNIPTADTLNDSTYDIERCNRRKARESLAREHGISLNEVEDCLSMTQGTAFDRRVAKAQLAASRDRLGW